MPIVKCKTCGKLFNKALNRIKKSANHFCSKECQYKSFTKKKEVRCSYCGKKFAARNWQLKKYKTHFCSVECQKKYVREEHPNQVLQPINCKFCGKLFTPTTVKNIYCSHECWSNDYKKLPNIIIEEDYAIIKVKYKEISFNVLIDKDDVEKCKKYRWTLLTNSEKFPYFRNSEVGLLHRYIMDCPDDMVVDHINHNTLDNRRKNLRICTFKENCGNRNLINRNSKTGYTYINVGKGGTYVVIVRKKNLGSYKNIGEAIEVRDKYLKETEL